VLDINPVAIVLFLAGVCGLAIVMLQSLQISRMKQRIDMLTGGAEGDLEAVLGQHLETVHEVGQDLDELTARMAVLESAGRHHFARQGLVRFSPFEDTGGNQSFALALLDESDDGLVISSLHSRTGTRIYAKAVVNGKADATTSPEEARAIDEARNRRGAGAESTGRAAASRTKAAAAAAVANPGASAVSAAQPAAGPKSSAGAPAVAPVAAPARSVPPKPVPSPPPAPAKAVPAVVAAPTPAEPVDETTERPSTELVKGQIKSKVVDQPGTESEKSGRKPGRQPASEASEQADKPGA
jgi:Protein of unknown function (DUF4446)